jgi:hypothetical protein
MQEPCRRLPLRLRLAGKNGGCKEKRMRPRAEAEALKLQAPPRDADPQRLDYIITPQRRILLDQLTQLLINIK